MQTPEDAVSYISPIGKYLVQHISTNHSIPCKIGPLSLAIQFLVNRGTARLSLLSTCRAALLLPLTPRVSLRQSASKPAPARCLAFPIIHHMLR